MDFWVSKFGREGERVGVCSSYSRAQMPWFSVFLSSNSMLDCMSSLEKEVKLDYEHTINRINFDRVVASKPQMFSYVTLPDKEEKEAPERGRGHREAICIQCGYLFDRILGLM